MATLYDASVLTGPDLAEGGQIMPEGTKGAVYSIAAPMEPLQLRNATPSDISVRDVVVIGDVEYTIVRMQYLWGYTEFKEGGRDVEALVVHLSNGTDQKRLWVPYDGHLLPWGQSSVGTLERQWINRFEDAPRFPLSYIAADDENLKIDVTCFATGTLIDTEQGLRPVQTLRVGDMIRTRDHGLQPLRWLGARQLRAADLGANPKLCPIRIAAGALGPGIPARELVVSPQHRMLVRSPIAHRMAGSPEVLIAAVHLLDLPGFERDLDCSGVGYWHLMFDRHEIVFAEGAEAESLYLGPMAISAISDEGREELRALFPDLMGPAGAEPPPPARPILRGKPVRKLIERQVKNCKPLVTVLA